MILKTLGKKQFDVYHDQGFLVVKNLFSDLECDDILKIIYQNADENFSTILNLDREEEEIRNVMKSQKIVPIIEDLQQAEVVGIQSQVVFKEPGSPYASYTWNPHQDNPYVQCRDGADLNCHIALVDHNIENGCLYGFSESHKEGAFPYESKISYGAKSGTNPGNKILDEILEKYKENYVDFFLEKGDTMFVHGNTIHGSHPNLSKTRARSILTLCYLNKGEFFVPGKNAKRVAIPLH